MARVYAGVLGFLGMGITLLRGAIAGGGLEGTVSSAVYAMVTLALVGFVVGWIAEATIDESVRSRMEKQLAELKGDE